MTTDQIIEADVLVDTAREFIRFDNRAYADPHNTQLAKIARAYFTRLCVLLHNTSNNAIVAAGHHTDKQVADTVWAAIRHNQLIS